MALECFWSSRNVALVAGSRGLGVRSCDEEGAPPLQMDVLGESNQLQSSER